MNVKTVIRALFFFTLFSCKVDPKINIAPPTNKVTEVIPEGWPQPVYRFENNPLSEKKFQLGRALFYEEMLSSNNAVSCGECHQQVSAFANTDHKVSHGVNNLEGTRNSPGIFNLAWHPSFMHDGGVNHIEVQPLAPISNPVEMNEDISKVIAKLSATDYYRGLFKDAFGSEEITTERMMKSLAQFMGMMYSYNSKFDMYKRGEDNVQLSASELSGYSIFSANCNSCHKEPLFSDFEFRSNGLRVNPLVNDSGRARITRDPADLYKFKTPSLRNIAVSGPYMHDGSVSTLQQCIDHYTKEKSNLTNLDKKLAFPFQLSTQQKTDLEAFLFTLTDYEFLEDPRFKEPSK